jgi:hypothetical protein
VVEPVGAVDGVEAEPPVELGLLEPIDPVEPVEPVDPVELLDDPVEPKLVVPVEAPLLKVPELLVPLLGV